jgi:hypothetical protein
MAGVERWTSDRMVAETHDAIVRPRLLLLCDYQPDNAATVIDHIEAIRRWSSADVYVLPMLRDLPDELDLAAFDAVVIHYNLIMAESGYLSPLARWRIARFQGVKAAFIQDEYRFVDRTVSVMRTLGIHVLFTCVPEDQVHLVYPPERLPLLRRAVTVLTGYVPSSLLELPIVSYEDRRIDVGYRARRLPVWLGRLAEEKWRIADRFAADAPAWGLTVDVSWREEDRLYGDAWIDFVSHARAMLGVESGASVFDFDGSIEMSVRAWQASHPGVSDEDLYRRFVESAEGRVRLNQISPRCFEAAALGTLMVLYPGDYSGILEAGRHYVPLEKDHSNMAEVVAAIRDRATWERITRQARMEVAENSAYSFRSVAATLDAALDLRPGPGHSLGALDFERVARSSLAAMAQLRRLPPRAPLARAGWAAARATQRLAPSPTSTAVYPGQDLGRLRALKRAVRYLRGFAWWLLRPWTIPPIELVRGGPQLIDDLCQLRLMQSMGARAVHLTSVSPFVLVQDRAAGELRIVYRRPEHAAPPAGTPRPSEISWARSIAIDLRDPWLVPVGLGDAVRPWRGLSALLRRDPRAVRRLLFGGRPWFEPEVPGLGSSADVQAQPPVDGQGAPDLGPAVDGERSFEEGARP